MTEPTHTPLPASDLLPISYRPDPFDDWGTIRAAPGSTGAGGVAWPMGRIRDPRVLDADLWKFRVAGTDPYEAVGKMFVHAVNSHHDLIEALREARTELSITRTNIMCEINRCTDPRDSRWEGVPEILKERIAKIDAILTKAEAGHG